MKKLLAFISIALVIQACTQKESSNDIINKAIQSAGGEKFENSIIEFDFREHHYLVERKGGDWRMERSKTDTNGILLDVFSSNEFSRTLNDSLLSPPDSMVTKYKESINSVIYFALLPYKLNDPAVISKRLKDVSVEGQDYYKIEIRFKEEGGGTDFQDVFIYWINQADYSLDYLAYSYQTDGGGVRFRKAINERIVDGIRFLDYINYKSAKGADVKELAKAYENHTLEELSRIELKNILVDQG